ncbi:MULTISPECIES: DUF4349 domain-containing protein [unclassified Nocardioides]|uniref:DUF4349 domain-containing protein n=1 Tax=unclassified Nocardioides TaxID=2615069 RepID=UPI0009F0FA5E|nr:MULTISPECIES: DUF4349 domain-containing protein [unclassified Nocardioides]GAW51547.1 Lipoprotein (Precursor) [Nocardioides sp. PD653-B2]GAW54912.1 Lipoprotein (Precursor) [Nocardioides sp. PD653]
MKLTPARAFAPAVLALALAAGAGCSAGGGSADSSSVAGSVAGDAPAAAQAPAPAMDALTDDYSVADSSSVRNGAQSVATKPNPLVDDRALIRHGNVALRADDVGKAQFEVQQVVDTYAGQVTEEKTTTDDDGHPAYTRMVLRIPADDFPKAMEDLKGIDVAELESANTTEDDVTTKVIDTQSRLKTQRRSIDRITVLFDRAESIRDIMAIEAQLSRRQAELDSLERQAAYLGSQTSMATIVVSVDQIPEKKTAPPKEDKAGFLTGLSAGWHGLTTFAVALATVVGALLPWLIVVAIVGPPLLLLVRALRRRRPSAT